MTHEPMCPCNNADERGCFLINAETGKCISCVCGDKMGAYLDGYARGLREAREAVASLEPLLDRHKSEGGYDCCGCATIDYLLTDALAAIDALRGES